MVVWYSKIMVEGPPVQRTEKHEQQEPEPLALEEALRESIADRYQAEDPRIPILLAEIDPDERTHLTKNERMRAEKNAALLRLLNGHVGRDIRTVAVNGASPEAQFLSSLLSWSKEAAERNSIDLTGFCAESAPEYLNGELTTEQLYERLQFYEKYQDTDRSRFEEEQAKKVAATLGIQGEGVRWTDMIDVAFSEESADRNMRLLLSNVGTIPAELMNKRRFRGIRGTRVALALGSLARIESSEEKDMKSALHEAAGNVRGRRLALEEAGYARGMMEMARHERAKMLNYFFVGKNVEQLRRKGVQNVTLDTNGLFIQLRGFSSHIPYGLVSPEMLETLREGDWMSNIEYEETALRTAEQNTDLRGRVRIVENQMLSFGQKLNTTGTSEELKERFAREVLEGPEEFGKMLANNNLLMPDVLISRVEQYGSEGISALMRVAESIGAVITNEQLAIEHKENFKSYDLLQRTEQSYIARARVLNHPGYYNVTKIVRQILRNFPASDPEQEFLAFRGEYKKVRGGDQHSFVETVYKGVAARVLINEDKHLSGINGLHREYDRLPVFNRDRYTQLEGMLQSYMSFKRCIATLRLLAVAHDTQGHPDYQMIYREIESGLQFLLNHVTKFHSEGENSLSRYRNALSAQRYEDVMARLPVPSAELELQKTIAIFDEADRTYAEFLYNTIGTQRNFTETFVPNLEKKNVDFGEKFVKEAEERCAKDGWNEELCSSGARSRVVEISYQTGDPSETIPFYLEASAVDRLGIPRDKRPLINIIGGARSMETDEKNANDVFARSVFHAAHGHRANVGVPGTQSGIGEMFGKEYLQYLAETEHLPDKEKAHYFSVNPGGNTFYPGNPFLEGTPHNEIFAITPIPSIVTPFKAGWELTGRERFESPYRQHVAYMEALYRRVSDKDDRLMVVGNGGLYTIFEVNASIDNDFKLFLVRGTGRFADVAALFSDRLHEQDLNPRALSDEEFAERVIERVRSKLPEDVAEEFLKKDFGSEVVPENEDYEVYRYFFREYMMRVTKGYYTEIRSLDLKDLEEQLSSYFTVAEKQYRGSRFPYESI